MNKRNEFDWGMYEPFKPMLIWLKKHATIIASFSVIGFAFGYAASENRMELDCKYAKAVRLNSTAFKCERVI